MSPPKVETRSVLAGRYLLNATSYLLHAVRVGDPKTLCGRISAAYLTDELAQDVTAAPTCKACLRKDPRFTTP
jgi:hypothetical protein